MLAGHETTSSSMNWILMELAKHPDYQSLVREEISRVRREVVARGDEDFTMADLDNMPYLTAAIKVITILSPYIWPEPALFRRKLCGITLSRIIWLRRPAVTMLFHCPNRLRPDLVNGSTRFLLVRTRV